MYGRFRWIAKNAMEPSPVAAILFQRWVGFGSMLAVAATLTWKRGKLDKPTLLHDIVALGFGSIQTMIPKINSFLYQ